MASHVHGDDIDRPSENTVSSREAPLNESPPRVNTPSPGLAELALRVADHVPAMLAYWNTEQVCLFANQAYLTWFGKSPDQVIGSTMAELLGPIYQLNLPHIRGALTGEVQVFERTIPRPDGDGVRESLATYLPDVVDGVVRGFFVQVADVSALKALERALTESKRQLEIALSEVRTLEGLLPICMHCKRIRDEQGEWTAVESYVRARTEAEFSHGICPSCFVRHYPEYEKHL
jgi:PAS domain S-box-containing protein